MSQRLLVFIVFLSSMMVSYAKDEIDYKVIEQDNHIIHLAKFDPTQVRIQLIQAKEESQNKAPLSQLASQEGAWLAINAGFFSLDDQDQASPVGVLKINNTWIQGSSLPRAALGWNENESIIDNLKVHLFPNEIRISPLRTSLQSWQNMTNVVGGVPLLVYDGKIVKNFKNERIRGRDFVDQPNARTAIGITATGHWIIVVVEQRYTLKNNETDNSLLKKEIPQNNAKAKKMMRDNLEIAVKGFTLHELSDFMHKQGCKWAINLDGGVSSGLYYQDEMKTHLLQDFPSNAPLFFRDINTAIIIKARETSLK